MKDLVDLMAEGAMWSEEDEDVVIIPLWDGRDPTADLGDDDE